MFLSSNGRKWRRSAAKQKPRGLSTKCIYAFETAPLVAEVGFERPCRKYSRFVRSASLASKLLIFALVALPLSATGGGRAPSPLPPPPFTTGEGRVWFRSRRSKKQRTPIGVLCFLVAEVGFEPHDLRVMSPTSYQAALLRDILPSTTRVVPVTGIEPVRVSLPTGF